MWNMRSSWPASDGSATTSCVASPDVYKRQDQVLAEKDARLAELERQLEAKKADDNAIAQALIIAQRSADEIMANANAQAAGTIQDAKDEAQRILDRVENEKQEVLDAIKKLEDDREDARDEYQDLLKDLSLIHILYDRFAEAFGDVAVPKPGHVDLPAAVVCDVERAGVDGARVCDAGACTA